MIYLRLFYEFFITGLLTFGGGLTSIPFLKEMGENTGWFDTAQLMDMVAISEAAPGPIGINIATYVGFTVGGVPGGIIAATSLLLPSVFITLTVARLLARFRESSLVKSALYGLRPASLGLIAAAGLSVLFLALFDANPRNMTIQHFSLLDIRALLLAAVLFIVTNKVKAHPIVFLAASAVIGIIIF